MRLLIVDDNAAVRRGLRNLLESKPDLEICGEAVNGRDAIAKAQQLRPDSILMDLSMPDMNGLDATREISRLLPRVRIAVVSQHDLVQARSEAMSAGAYAFVPKASMWTDLSVVIDRMRQDV